MKRLFWIIAIVLIVTVTIPAQSQAQETPESFSFVLGSGDVLRYFWYVGSSFTGMGELRVVGCAGSATFVRVWLDELDGNGWYDDGGYTLFRGDYKAESDDWPRLAWVGPCYVTVASTTKNVRTVEYLPAIME